MTRVLAASLVLFVSSWGWAQTGDLDGFLEPLRLHPAVRAAAESVRAARYRLDGTAEPFGLSVTGGFSAFDNEAIDLAPEVPGEQGLPGSGGQLSADLTLKPFPIYEQVEQARVAYEQALLDYRDTLTGLELQALSAALQVQLAERSLALSQESAELSETALAATRLRLERGAATERELRDAEAGVLEAQTFVANAENSLRLARASLAQLVPGPSSLDVAALSLKVPSGTPLGVARAELGVAGAEVGVSAANKALFPVLQAGYTWNLDERSSVGVGLETRTLQPRLSYSYQDPGRSLPQSAVNGSFQFGLSMNFSAANINEANASEAQLAAARAGVQAARDGADLQRLGLDNALESAQRALELAELRFENARATLREAQRREQLGLGVPLETQQAALDVAREALDYASARQDVLSAILDYYSFYALPLTEVAP